VHRAQIRLVEQLSEMTFMCSREIRFVSYLGIELAGGLPKLRQGCAAPRVIPDTRGNDSTWRGNALHLAQACNGITHEMHDELREGCIEHGIVERQLLGGGASHVDSRIATPRGSDEGLGRVDRANSSHSDSLDELRRERTRPAADVHYPLPDSDPAQVGELGCELCRISADEPVVGFGRDVEPHQRESRCEALSRSLGVRYTS